MASDFIYTPAVADAGVAPAGAEQYLTPPEVAAFTRLAVQTLAKMRCEGGGPQYVKTGRRVVYPMSALRRWMDARVRSSTSDSGK
jgi:predicted DNA-binding transcriptional regulator AlpA